MTSQRVLSSITKDKSGKFGDVGEKNDVRKLQVSSRCSADDTPPNAQIFYENLLQNKRSQKRSQSSGFDLTMTRCICSWIFDHRWECSRAHYRVRPKRCSGKRHFSKFRTQGQLLCASYPRSKTYLSYGGQIPSFWSSRKLWKWKTQEKRKRERVSSSLHSGVLSG